jgi:hypothetical protein
MTEPAARPQARRTWRRLPSDERQALLGMLVMVPLFHVAVRVWDYQRTRAFVDTRSLAYWQRRQSTVDAQSARPAAYGLASRRMAARPWLPGNCLSRSLAVLWFLRRHGYTPDLRLGVSLADGTFAAHAWVELNGVVLNDRRDVAKRFAPLSAATPARSFD